MSGRCIYCGSGLSTAGQCSCPGVYRQVAPVVPDPVPREPGFRPDIIGGTYLCGYCGTTNCNCTGKRRALWLNSIQPWEVRRAAMALAAIGFAFQRIADHLLAVTAVSYVLPWNADPQRAAGIVDRFEGVARVAAGVTSVELVGLPRREP